MTRPDIPIIILAAGQSSRMNGADKLLLAVDGAPLLRRQARIARSVTTGPVLVALPPPPHDRYAALDGVDVTPVVVADADEGMNASLRSAMSRVPEVADHAMVMLGDLPDLTTDDLNFVLQSVEKYPENLVWRGATQDGEPGHPVVFARSLFAPIAGLSGDSGGRGIMRLAKNKLHLVPLPGSHARTDLDTPDDWRRWRTANPRR